MSTEAEDIQAEEAGLDQEDPRFEAAVLGREIEQWIETDPIGQYIVARAREEIEEVKEALLTEEDGVKIKALQSRAAICSRVAQWLGEAVQAGRASVIALQTERDIGHVD